MKNFINWKSVLGTLGLGLIGSALWESVFSGMLPFLGKTLLTISTLGIQVYKDNIYLDIAKGFYERGSLQGLSFGLSVFFGIAFGMLAILYLKENRNSSRKEDIKYFLRERGLGKIVAFGYTTFVFGVVMLSLSRMVYVNKSIAYYHQLLNIAAPTLSVEQEEVFNARFSQIANRNDYINVINELRSISEASGAKLPKEPSFIF